MSKMSEVMLSKGPFTQDKENKSAFFFFFTVTLCNLRATDLNFTTLFFFKHYVGLEKTLEVRAVGEGGALRLIHLRLFYFTAVPCWFGPESETLYWINYLYM